MENKNLDKAGLPHWNSSERNSSIEFHEFTPKNGVRGYARRIWHRTFVKVFDILPQARKDLLELGCGGSNFLPYFSNHFGFHVSGIDYSPNGINLTRRMCLENGVTPSLFCVDFFNAPSHCLNRFDAVVSFGVVEHFTDTDQTILEFSKFLRPSGILLTVVPNMEGLTGLGQRLFSLSVFNMHEKITPHRLREAHNTAGLEVLQADYFMFNNFGVINIGNQSSILKRIFFNCLRAITVLVWSIETVIGSLPPNKITSPYVICIARKTIKVQG